MAYNNYFHDYDFDSMLWPVLVTDSKGKVLYKNEFASKIKLIRKGKNASCLFRIPDELEETFKMGNSRIAECKSSLGISHAIIMCSDEYIIIFFIVNTMLIKSILDESYLETHRITYSTNELVISTYKSMCEKMNLLKDEKAKEILKYNSLQFFRASRNYEMYYLSLTKTAFLFKDELVDISELCKTVSERFAKQLSPLGYRFYADISAGLLATSIKTDVFIPVFLETASLVMKMSDDKTCSVTVSELLGMIKFDYTFKCSSIETAEVLYAAELDFIKAINENSLWKYSGITPLSNNTYVISFSVPVTADETVLLSDNIFTQNIRKEYYQKLTDSVISSFYFA
ncbi:MAG: hypothetical protein E7621_02720 [Ruminococcaceae bacterium]|nr:hypothetical protein [Oscillospiraceae bacterium]